MALVAMCLSFLKPDFELVYLEFRADYKRWEEDIEKWQSPILNDDRLPEW